MKKIILPVVMFIAFLAIFLPRFLIKARVECRSQFGNCPTEVTDKISKSTGKSIFVAEKSLKKELKSNFLVSTFSIQFKLPNILRVDLIVKKPIFALKNAETGKLSLVDKDGNVLAEADVTILPIVTAKGDMPKIGQKVGGKELLALELIDGIYKMYQTGSGNIESDTLLVDLPGGVRVIFPLVDADRDLLLGSLRLIYSNIRNGEGNSQYSQIDLRYKNPVLR